MPFPLDLFFFGMCLMEFAGIQLVRGLGVEKDSLRVAGLPSKKWGEIRMMIYRRVLPGNPTLRRFVFERAEYDVATDQVQLLWTPLLLLGVLLMVCVFYLVPFVPPGVVVAQCVFVFYYLLIWIIDCRRVRNSARLLRLVLTRCCRPRLGRTSSVRGLRRRPGAAAMLSARN